MTPAALRALCARVLELDGKATRGPWMARRCGYAEEGTACAIRAPGSDGDYYEDPSARVVQDTAYDECGHMMSTADAEAIAEYRTAAPTLARALSEALDKTDGMKSWIDAAVDDYEQLTRILRAAGIEKADDAVDAIEALLRERDAEIERLRDPPECGATKVCSCGAVQELTGRPHTYHCTRLPGHEGEHRQDRVVVHHRWTEEPQP